MQDRYVGDIGDFGKIALLKALQKQGLSIGVNWYKTGPLESEKDANGAFKKNDGGYPTPIKYRGCDEELYDRLEIIFNSKTRTIEALKNLNLIPGAEYFPEPVSVSDRAGWHQRAMAELDTDLVFLDPDNGLLVDSVSPKSVRSVKYVLYEEVEQYLCKGKSVLVYNHRCRKPKEKYFREIFGKLQSLEKVTPENILVITFPRRSVRDYFAVAASEDHRKKIENAFRDMTQGDLSKKICYILGW